MDEDGFRHADTLIPPQPPNAAIDARRRKANEAARGDHYHAIANPAAKPKPNAEPAGGYRPGRKTAVRRGRRGKPGGSGPTR